MTSLSFEERVDWLRLIRSDGVGPVTFRHLIDRFGSAAAAIERAPAMRAGRNGFRLATQEAAERELAVANDLGASVIASCEPGYPQFLREIPDAPPILYQIGRGDLHERPAIAIVGSRNASLAGRKMAATLAADLGAAGFVVVSGLARGIDGVAHEAALSSGTIAVVAGGVDVVYPPEHGDLMRAIAQEGAILSERPPGAAPTARDFPRRNRMISGLSKGVIVVEAAARSGTLITARQALDQGRDVFAVPGSPLDPRSEGANKLIAQGAGLITSAADVIEAINAAPNRLSEPLAPRFDYQADSFADDTAEDIAAASSTTSSPSKDDNALAGVSVKSTLRELLSATPSSKDDLIRATGAPASAVLDALCELTLKGEAAESDDGGFIRSP
ncbi:MAG: DNA-processing protein DprA [Pseudomonadota bacterium]